METVVITVEEANRFLDEYYDRLNQDDNVVAFTDFRHQKNLPMDCESVEF